MVSVRETGYDYKLNEMVKLDLDYVPCLLTFLYCIHPFSDATACSKMSRLL